jgi:hypothetical protein
MVTHASTGLAFRSRLRVPCARALRCNALTGGSEVRALLRAVDSELTSYISAMQSAVAGLGARQKARAAATGGGGGGGATAAAEDVEEIANVLQLIKVRSGERRPSAAAASAVHRGSYERCFMAWGPGRSSCGR